MLEAEQLLNERLQRQVNENEEQMLAIESGGNRDKKDHS